MTKQRYNFSVTQPPQFEFRQVPLIPGTDVMKGSVFQDFNSLAGILKNLQPTRVKDDDYENIEEFVEAPDYRNPLQKALDFYKESPQARLGIGALLGGPVGALASLFAPKIFDTVSEGIGNIFGPRVDMGKVTEGIQSNVDDDSQEGGYGGTGGEGPSGSMAVGSSGMLGGGV